MKEKTSKNTTYKPQKPKPQRKKTKTNKHTSAISTPTQKSQFKQKEKINRTFKI
ncbi:hypothetical protein HYE01_00260 [Mycoplasmopsis bovis]|nr:hypothetical protein HYE01_00260 [Mycoplasmopsis bovis]